MKTIWKFQLRDMIQTFKIPEGSMFLNAQTQYGVVCLWFLVDSESPLVERKFILYGTGIVLPDNPGTYMGTCQEMNDKLVWHVFELYSDTLMWNLR